MKRRTALKMVLAPVAMEMTKALGGWRLSAQTPGGSQLRVEDQAEARAGEVALVAGDRTSDIYVDAKDFEVVKIAAGLLADDVERVTGKRPAIKSNAAELGANAVIMGTLGRSRLIDQIVSAGQLDSTRIQGWEAYGIKVVAQPLDGVGKALVIAGSDRRGTAYGVMDLSRRIGVSPFYWWADVPVRKRQNLVAATGGEQISESPSVKYRGIFINDELWGFLPWAMETFDPGNEVGPKTYRKVFELMLRLRLNYLWPSTGGKEEFGAVPGNCALADQWAIVMGSSHAEPILRSPASWNVATEGPWDYATNRANMLAYWKEWAQARGKYEAVWTVGLRGNGDLPMIGPKTEAGQIAILEEVFRDQRELLRKYVVPARDGKIAQDFVMYNEVLNLFDDGLKVPTDVTLVWPDDNWGYIRQLPDAAQQKRPGGSGVYYHVDYSGQPHDHCWFSATPPSKIWEEMRKAWDNHARTLWVVNVGDIKSQEIDTDFWARFAWNVDEFGPESQPVFLKNFAEESFGRENAGEIASILAEFFRLCFIRKPDTMGSALCIIRTQTVRSAWAAGLPPEFADLLLRQYQSVLERAEKVALELPEEARAAYFELVLYPVRMLCASGSTFINYDRYLNSQAEPAKAQEYARAVRKWNRMVLENTDYYNNTLEGGKWKRMMTVGGSNTGFCDLYQLPDINNTAPQQKPAGVANEYPSGKVLGAAQFSRKFAAAPVRWHEIEGLGWSGRAMAWEKMVAANRWEAPGDLGRAPRLEYDVRMDDATSDFSVLVHVLPTFQLNPSLKLRVAAGVDQSAPQLQEVPLSRCSYDNKTGDRTGIGVRSQEELANRATVEFPFRANGRNLRTVKIWTPDPGIVLDQIEIRTRK